MRAAPWVLAGTALLVGVIGAPPPTMWTRLYFGVLILCGVVALAGLAGQRVQLAVAAVICVLALSQRVGHHTVADPPPSQWTAFLREPTQRIEHQVLLPVGSASWDRLWRHATSAGIYVCARGPLTPEARLQVLVGDELLATLTESYAFGPRPQPTSVGFYRVPVSRRALEKERPATLVLRQEAGAGQPAEICGTFSYRPTAGLGASRFFDGVAWSSPGLTQQGRFLLEVRIEDAEQRALAAFY